MEPSFFSLLDPSQTNMTQNIEWYTQHLCSLLGIKHDGKDVRHDTLNDAKANRYPDSLYEHRDTLRMLFYSKRKPEADSFGIHGRAHQVTAARDAIVRSKNPVPERWNEEERAYLAPVGVLHLDRCWAEQGHQEVGVSPPPLSSTVPNPL